MRPHPLTSAASWAAGVSGPSSLATACRAARRRERPAWSPYVSRLVAPSPPPPSAQAVPISVSVTSRPWITTFQAKGFSDQGPWGSPSCSVSRSFQPLAQSAQAVSQPAYRLQGTWRWKARLLTPFFLSVVSREFEQLAAACSVALLQIPEALCLPCVFIFIYFSLISIPAQISGGFFSAGLGEASWYEVLWAPGSHHHRLRGVLGAFLPHCPCGLTAFVLSRFHIKVCDSRSVWRYVFSDNKIVT